MTAFATGAPKNASARKSVINQRDEILGPKDFIFCNITAEISWMKQKNYALEFSRHMILRICYVMLLEKVEVLLQVISSRFGPW